MNVPEADTLLRRLPQMTSRWSAGELDANVCAAIYFLYWQMAIHGTRFASRQHKHDPRPDLAQWLAMLELETPTLRDRLIDCLERYQFRGVTAAAPIALAQWLRGRWPLILCEAIPTPADVLRMQVQGTRAVTMLTAYPRMLEPVLGKPNAFAFFLHDLEHAYKFFHSPELHAGQLRFFALLQAAIERAAFAPYLEDPVFVEKFHYLMSDMNTHPNHSRQYLRAILIECLLRREGRAPTEPLSDDAQRALENVMRTVADTAPSPACACAGTSARFGNAAFRMPRCKR